jgi:hypothetical protein
MLRAARRLAVQGGGGADAEARGEVGQVGEAPPGLMEMARCAVGRRRASLAVGLSRKGERTARLSASPLVSLKWEPWDGGRWTALAVMDIMMTLCPPAARLENW